MTAAIRIIASVDPDEHPALLAAAEQLSEALTSTGEAWNVQLHYDPPGTAPVVVDGVASAVVTSLLPETARPDEAIEATEARWSERIAAMTATGAPVLVCNVFRVAPRPADAPGAPSDLLDRIRRLNLLAVRLSHRFGVWVVDLDRALAHIGSQALQADYRLQSRLAAEAAGQQIVWCLLSGGLDDVVSPEISERARGFHGDLQHIDNLIRRRLPRPLAMSRHG